MDSKPIPAMGLIAAAMLGVTFAKPPEHGMTRMGKPARFNPPKSIPREEREKRRAKKKQAVASKRRNRK